MGAVLIFFRGNSMNFNVLNLASKYYRYIHSLGVVLIVSIIGSSFAYSIPALDLRSMKDFAIIAGSTITGVPPVMIKGNVGLSPAAGSFVIGFDGTDVDGNLYVVDASGPPGSINDATLMQTAKSDLTIAYNDAAGRTPVPTGDFLNPGGGDIGGLNLVPGLYKFTSAAGITGSDVTLTGGPNDVWIFQIASSLNLGSGIKVILAGGAQAANIFWQVGTSATLGTYSTFKGTILADQSISLGTGATIDGRSLAFEGAVTMGSGVTTNRSDLASGPIFSSDKSQLNFGNVSVGSSKQDSVTITNIGTADLIMDSVRSSNIVFTVTPNNATIAPNASKKYYVTFTPTAAGLKNAFVYFYHNDPDKKDSISLSGTGVTAPIFTVNPTSLNFGNVAIGNSKKDSVTVTNTGTANLIISSVTSSNTSFTVTPLTGTIAPGGSQKYYVTFTPVLNGSNSGKVYFNHNDPSLKDSISVSGVSVAPIFTVNPQSLNFGNVLIGVSKKDSVTVTNTGTSDLIITSMTRSNTSYSFTPSNGTIAPGASMKFYITFAPLTDGLKSGYIYFNHNDVSLKDSISVTGTGVSPRFTANPTVLNFGDVVNGTSKLDSIIVSNVGTYNLIISNVTSSNGLFVVTPANFVVAPGTSKTFYVTFSPLVDGIQNGAIYFYHNASSIRSTVVVSGNGVSPKFSVNPNSLNFGNVVLGSDSTKSVTVTNTGTSALIINNMTSSNGQFTVDPTPITILPGAAYNIDITFAPLSDGLKTGYIYFYHNASNLKDSVSVSGTGVSPRFTVTPTHVDFGEVRNGTDKTEFVTVTNTGTSNLVISSVTSDNAVYTVSQSDGAIAPGASEIFYITFSPLVDGLQTGNIYFNHNAATMQDIVTVSGTGISPIFSVNLNNLDFGDVRNHTTKTLPVTVTNIGTASLNISSITSNNPLFTIVSQSGGPIAPGESEIIYITFSPLVDGLQSGNIYFNHDAANMQNIVTVSGTGVSSKFSINLNNIDFGEVRNGTTKTDFVIITNTGTASLNISDIISSNDVFTVDPEFASIAPGATMKIYITFAPIVDGLQNGIIYFNHDALNMQNTITVTGTGVSPHLSFNRLYIDFGDVLVGDSKLDSVMVYNTGRYELIIFSTTSTYKLFTVTPAGGTLAPGDSMLFYIRFTPIENGLRKGYVYFNDTDNDQNFPVSLKGVGVSPKFAIMPSSLNFGMVKVGKTKMDSVMVTNTGNMNLIISQIVSVDDVFAISPGVASIAPGESKKFYVTFTPKVDGLVFSFLNFIHNAPNKNDWYSVTGIGGDDGQSPVFFANVSSLDFGTLVLGDKKQLSVKVTNKGLTDLLISEILSTNAHYTVSQSSGVIPPGASQDFFITFEPTVIGRVDAQIRFTHNAGIDIVNVTGNAIDVMTISDARKLPLGTEFAIEGIVTRSAGSYTRVQDPTAAITLVQHSGAFFDEVAGDRIKMGDRVRIQGVMSELDYLMVVNGTDLVAFERLSRSNVLPIPQIVTLAEVAANGEKYESELINVVELTIQNVGDATFLASTTYLTTDPSDKTNTVVIRIGNTADTYMDGMPMFETGTFVGVLGQSSLNDPAKGYQLTPVLSTDLFFVVSGVLDNENASVFSLSDNYPNPFSKSSTIEFNLIKPDFVTLKIMDVLGNTVKTLVEGYVEAGSHSVTYFVDENSQVQGSGTYFYRLDVGKYSSTKQMLLVK